MIFAEKIYEIARKKQKRIVFPEGTEIRTLFASRKILDQQLASEVVLIGNKETITSLATKNDINLLNIKIIDPRQSPLKDKFKKELFELRKHKGMTEEQASIEIENDLNWGSMMVRLGYSDGMVAGAENSTGKVLVSAFKIIKTAPNIKYASSAFLMAMENTNGIKKSNLIFSDCATIIDPTAEQLAEIAFAAAETCRTFLEEEPRIALLSFSTKGSAKHKNVDKVSKALELIKKKDPNLNVEGELQGDAALVESISNKKAPGSSIAGNANVLIFPDLQSGNISYKLVQHLAGAEAYGPILQGFAKPVSDLSRGCSIEDIVTITAMTLAQAK